MDFCFSASPASYGALGEAICPTDPDIMVGQGCEWRLDPQTGQARVTAVTTREGMENSRFAIGTNGRVYLAVASKWAVENGLVKIFERLGEGAYKLRCTFRPEGKDMRRGPSSGRMQTVTSRSSRKRSPRWRAPCASAAGT